MVPNSTTFCDFYSSNLFLTKNGKISFLEIQGQCLLGLHSQEWRQQLALAGRRPLSLSLQQTFNSCLKLVGKDGVWNYGKISKVAFIQKLRFFAPKETLIIHQLMVEQLMRTTRIASIVLGSLSTSVVVPSSIYQGGELVGNYLAVAQYPKSFRHCRTRAGLFVRQLSTF